MSTAPCEPVLGSAMVSKVNFTASALKGVPSWNFTSSRSFSVTDLLSGATVQDLARPG